MTRIIHTADWHLGARLVDHERLPEQQAFLEWLLVQMAELSPDLLIVAGDIFDSTNPPQEALTLYYQFLARLAATVPCRVLILGGNHDSPSTLNAPREILTALQIEVVGAARSEASAAILNLQEAVVCAVPFLRERDVRKAAPGQQFDEVALAIREGITRYYREIFEAAAAVANGRLMVATGHLTAMGSQASPSERIIHIGNLGAVDAGCFEGFAYTALGHIHQPQSVGGKDCVRYSGSPIALSFSEADTNKEICVIDIDGSNLSWRSEPIPVFRSLLRITSTAESLAADLAACQSTAPFEPWVELTVTDAHSHPDLDRQVRDATLNLRLRVLKLIAAQRTALIPNALQGQSLDDLNPEEVFAERLLRGKIELESEEGRELIGTFAELLSAMQEAEEVTSGALA